MKEYGYNLEATHAAAIFEKGTEAANGQTHTGYTPGLVIGSSEWIWLEEDHARRICAALTYFSETTTEEVERMAAGSSLSTRGGHLMTRYLTPVSHLNEKWKTSMTQLDGQPYSPRVVCAAIRVGDQIICGARHYDGLMIQQIKGRNELGKWRGAEQGFVDQWGKWLTREEAWIVASREGQIINDPDWCAGSLHSEHLY